MEKILFGKLCGGEEIYKYVLKNSDAELTVMNFGAAITSFKVFGRDIVGGYDNISDYEADDSSHQGAAIGRVANRIGGAQFKMDGKVYTLPKNDGNNCLHGGNGFDRRIWEVAELTEDSITFTYVSADGEEGFPGELAVKVTYRLFGSAVAISYEATPSSKTPIALTNHSYFNLEGFGTTIDDHKMQIFASEYTEVNDELIPTRAHPSVVGTPLDLRTMKRLGDCFNDDFTGFDHNFILKPDTFADFFGVKLGLAAKAIGGGLLMKVYTDQPGIQFYSGNFLCGKPNFKGGIERIYHGAFCLETQTEPDCINSGIGFYEASETYRHNTVYTVEKLEENN